MSSGAERFTIWTEIEVMYNDEQKTCFFNQLCHRLVGLQWSWCIVQPTDSNVEIFAGRCSTYRPPSLWQNEKWKPDRATKSPRFKPTRIPIEKKPSRWGNHAVTQRKVFRRTSRAPKCWFPVGPPEGESSRRQAASALSASGRANVVCWLTSPPAFSIYS